LCFGQFVISLCQHLYVWAVLNFHIPASSNIFCP
jgi:hypothetical protein